MTTPANDHNKPSPADTPTERPADEGHKSVVKNRDKQYHADEPEQQDVAKKHENEEQPVTPIKKAPKDDQPDASDDDARGLESK
ncbi:hypothetical protein [Mucilaginibacter psychrotolerans]|uniref:Uncharacterized protein n=1 Tax=Mucilaginibacter psychrotolerans TaxID=1524096 RepID=A0A4Y8SG01_9SPHI|nr:hypothetical protein [Mucilaginibacter psychrotolerans]TFF37959.1 hypothetical protein E2R66_10255 [Mucilaginibacter psychrotolerans]